MIEFYSIDRKVPDLDPELFVLALSSVVKSEHLTVGDISIVVCSDDYLLQMNKEHLDHDYYTDIITFDYCDGVLVSGDLFISLDRVNENAEKYSVTPLVEFARVCSHGVLHLCGYKDKSEEDEVVMREMEEKALRFFGFT